MTMRLRGSAEATWWAVAGRAFAAALLIASAGCSFGGRGESDPAASGDPEADQRAEQRVGADSGKGTKAAAKRELPLYERLGGHEAIAALVDDMVTRSVEDPRVNFERREVKTNFLGKKYPAWEPTPQNVDVLKRHMTEFLTLAAGGPAEYTGREVGEVHKGMKITNAEFDAMVGDIKASMDRLGFAAKEKKDLLAIIETTRKQIVEK
jgi:hemoglobin